MLVRCSLKSTKGPKSAGTTAEWPASEPNYCALWIVVRLHARKFIFSMKHSALSLPRWLTYPTILPGERVLMVLQRIRKAIGTVAVQFPIPLSFMIGFVTEIVL